MLERASQANQDSVGQSGPSQVHPLLGIPILVMLFFSQNEQLWQLVAGGFRQTYSHRVAQGATT